MKKKTLKNLELNKKKISKIQNPEYVKGGDTMAGCVIGTIALASKLFCSAVYGTCDCPTDTCDHTRDCESWNVACKR
ncbi:hypothetical protein [uncultured Kordia sp.]|uniref:hypothetical protein n=1 Tax=uncultured Kordia sp. TaxID=507699 RepID=UPI00262583ED|nr:hypothetical protein [uncultured Kordia sp.]